ncbi:GGDEF domain-containing protein [Pseudomonas bohemica]|uniref:GGDEF domain-containing protein n=1 Tax=Pseudomonas bohemica TaxID=2044872 RepID=UPI000DA61E91|nr:diguanylate cyclase [Pseudomonas bohemica]
MLAESETRRPETTAAPPRTGSLARRLVLATLTFCILFTLATVTLRTWFAWNTNLSNMNAELGLIDQVFQGTLSKAVWEMDNEALQAQIDSVALAPPVGRVELRILRPGRAPEVLERQHPGHAGSSFAPALHRQLIVTPYPGANEVVGELSIEGDARLLWRRLWKEVGIIMLTQIIQSLALAGLIMGMFNRSVTLHVRRIARHLEQLTPQNLKNHLVLGRGSKASDELDLLEAGVNDLQDKLANHIERQTRDELALAASRDQLAELVEQRTAQLKAANIRLEALTRFDPLTGLANRRHFDEIKELEFNRALRHRQPFSVLMCDIDFFKLYNDTYGHANGDQCLREVALTMSALFSRSGELVARLGGEEFAVLLPGQNRQQALSCAERLQALLAERKLPHKGSGVSPFVTMSIGIAELDPANMERFDHLLQSADKALYRAKSQGRNRCEI